MKYKDRKEQRKVCETINSLLSPLMPHLIEEDRKAVDTAIRILNSVGIEERA